MQLRGTTEQQLIFLSMHWGSEVFLRSSSSHNGMWTATANFASLTS
jgi:hypothetical protein